MLFESNKSGPGSGGRHTVRTGGESTVDSILGIPTTCRLTGSTQSIQNTPAIQFRNDYLECNVAANLESNVAAPRGRRAKGKKAGTERKSISS